MIGIIFVYVENYKSILENLHIGFMLTGSKSVLSQLLNFFNRLMDFVHKPFDLTVNLGALL